MGNQGAKGRLVAHFVPCDPRFEASYSLILCHSNVDFGVVFSFSFPCEFRLHSSQQGPNKELPFLCSSSAGLGVQCFRVLQFGD